MKEKVVSEKLVLQGKRLISVNEAANYLSCDPMTIRRHAWKGNLPFVRIGRKVLFDMKDLESFIDRNKFTLDMIRKKSYHDPKRGTAWERGKDGLHLQAE